MKKLPIKLSLILGITVALLAVVFWVGLMVGISPVYADDGSAPADSGAAPGDSGATDSGSVTATDETAIVDETAPADEAAPVDEATSVDESAPVDEAASGDELAPTDEVAPVDESTSVDEVAPTDEAAPVDETILDNTGTAIQTDRPDYAPTETPVISGAGFGPNSEVTITITAPDGTATTFTTTTDSQGQFTATYEGPLTKGEFTVAATDGVSTATTTFLDATVTLYPTDDASVYRNNPNYTDNTDSLHSKSGDWWLWWWFDDDRRAYLMFDLSALPDTADTRVVIDSATLYAYRYHASGDNPGDISAAYSTGDGWSESSITWNNQPGMDGEFQYSASNSGFGWIVWDVTGYAQDEYAGDKTMSIVLAFPTEDVLWDAKHANFYSTECRGTTFDPYLAINYTTQYYLTVDNGGHGTAAGEGWYAAGAPANFSISPTTVPDGLGTQYVFTGWTGSGTGSYTGPNASSSVIMNNPITETADWKTQYQLTMATNFGTTSPSTGDHWYDAGTVLTISATAPSVVDGEQYVWNGWTGSGDGSYTDGDNPSSVTMNDPITETASWTHQYYLTVDNGGHGTPGGYGWYDSGTNAQATVDPLTVPGPSGAYAFTNWSGNASGNTSPSNPIIIDAPKTAIAMWTFTPALLGGSVERVLVINWFGIVRAYLVNAAGALLENVYITSPDGNATLVIPAGTLVLDTNGLPLYLHPNPDIIAGMAGTPPAPPGTTIAAVYECLPSGVTFKWRDAQLIVRYDPATVAPGGVVVIAYYDEATGSWVELETAGYVVGGEEVPNTVISSVPHFTYFALLVKLPAE